MTADQQPGPGLGLPPTINACLFDLDGVLTRTATVHAAAWQRMFDSFLRAWADRTGQPFVPFDPVREYRQYLDGRPRLAGTRAFLAARAIELPVGDERDQPGAWTVHGLSGQKNQLVTRVLREDGVECFPGSVAYLRAVRAAGLACAVVSSSANTAAVLTAAGLADLFQVRVDARVADRRGLAGKPAPDTFRAAAADLGVPPERAAVFEDALAGVAAGRAGGFGLVVGVDRLDQAEELRAHGADLVVTDLADLLENRGEDGPR